MYSEMQIFQKSQEGRQIFSSLYVLDGNIQNIQI